MNSKMKSFVKGILLGLVSRAEFPQGKEPVAYLYNGVRLPKLPEWDKEKYPYAWIEMENSGFDLYVATDFAHSNDSFGFAWYTYPDTGLKFSCSDRQEWVQSDTFASGEVGAQTILWTNTSMYFADGSLAFAASEPVPTNGVFPVYPYDAGAGADTYSYNGIALPRWIDWDRVNYPYLTLFYNSVQDLYFFHATARSIVKCEDGWKYGYQGRFITIKSNDERTGWEDVVYHGNYPDYVRATEIVWSNADVFTDSGELYMQGINPAPVYE